MTQITEAIYAHGVLKPATDLNLREQQRVRVIVEPIEDTVGDRDVAVGELGPTLFTLLSARNSA
jgi:predicted DNA-binding antitoxin AbrB/MazE fold protein